MNSGCNFSIVIPTYNRLPMLERCLRGIASLSFPRGHFEVIVVNDGGAPTSREFEELFQRELDVQFYTQTNSGPAAARNFGAARAGGEWLIFTDDDCVPLPGWLNALALAGDGGNKVLGGRVVNGVSHNLQAEASQMLFAFLYLYYHCSAMERSQPPFFTSNNLAVPRSIFDDIGGFDPAMRNAEDRELCARIHARGINLKYVPAACIVHHRPMSLREFWRLHASYGGGGYDFYVRQKARGMTRFEPEGPGFYTGILLYPWRQTPRQAAVRLSALLALSQIANAFGFIRAMCRDRTA